VSTLRLLNVVKRYEAAAETVQAVDGVTLTVASGQLVAVYGPSGSGKTTLLAVAAAIVPPDEGRVLFGDSDVGALSPRQSARYRREQIGLVFQSFHLAPGASALENAAMKLLSLGHTLQDAEREVRPWLERLGLAKRLEHKPGELSTGERQRVAIARALANGPRLLLADEPTGNLDSRRSREVLELLVEICRERQMPALVVTHDPQAACVLDHVYTLRDGQLAEGLDLDLRVAL
jgi:putative ABC transport system ATP-binding protein